MTMLPDVAREVAAQLGEVTFSTPITVERHWLPRHDYADLSNRDRATVNVVPVGTAIERTGRSGLMNTHRIEIGIQQKLADGITDEIDALVILVSEIGRYFLGRTLTALPGIVGHKAEFEPVVALEHLNELSQFTSVITLTFKDYGR